MKTLTVALILTIYAITTTVIIIAVIQVVQADTWFQTYDRQGVEIGRVVPLTDEMYMIQKFGPEYEQTIIYQERNEWEFQPEPNYLSPTPMDNLWLE